MSDYSYKQIGDIVTGDKVFAFDHDQPEYGTHRRLRVADVSATFEREAEAIKISTDQGDVVTTADHPWLSGARWRRAGNLHVGDSVRWLTAPQRDPGESWDYQLGYFAGVSAGDACVGSWDRSDHHSQQHRYRLAVKDTVILDRVQGYLKTLDLPLYRAQVDCGEGMEALLTSHRWAVEKIRGIIANPQETPGWWRGWLAGIFDAEGSFSGSLRISQKPGPTLDRIGEAMDRNGFRWTQDVVSSAGCTSIRLLGGASEVLRFASVVRPSVLRKFDSLVGSGFKTGSATILDINAVGKRKVCDITTSEGTFWANGLASHNCYQGDHLVNKMPKGLVKLMDDQVAARGLDFALGWTARSLSVVWYGGEPMLNWPIIRDWTPRYREAFAKAGKSVSFSITTNGTRLTNESIETLSRHGVGMLLSLDGPPRLHNKTRVHFDGRPSWHEIPHKLIQEKLPNVEVAWQLDPAQDFQEGDLDDLIAEGYRRININLNWLSEWHPDAQMRLTRFFRYYGRKILKGEVMSNWKSKLDKALTVDNKMAQPCGTGLHMLALTPEGYLYPSQEMAFTVFEPGKAPGTAEHYRVGNVFNSPVIDTDRLKDVSAIKTSEMKVPAGYSCDNCVAKSVSIGGCHDLAGETPVMLATGEWREIQHVKVGDRVVSVTGDPDDILNHETTRRSWSTSEVTKTMSRKNGETISISTPSGVLIASPDHPMLARVGSGSSHWHRWLLAADIKPGDLLVGSSVAPFPVDESVDFRQGYMVGAVCGDGSIGRYEYESGIQHHVNLAVNDTEILDRFQEYAATVMPGVAVGRGVKKCGGYNGPQEQPYVYCASRAAYEVMQEWKPDSSRFLRGFLSGIFDAEGSLTGNASKGGWADLKLCQEDIPNSIAIKGKIAYALDYFGFDYRWDKKWLRVRGGRKERFRFLSLTTPAVSRKVERFFSGQLSGDVSPVLSIAPGPVVDLFHIETTLRNFLTPVGISHNCRYVGQNGFDPAYRFDVPEGYCGSMQPAMMGLLAAAAIERYIRPVEYVRGQIATGALQLPDSIGPGGKRVKLRVVSA